MKTWSYLMWAVFVLGTLTACSTLESAKSAEMVSLGDDSRMPNVVGVCEHLDILGLTLSGLSFAQEYETALDNAFKRVPDGTMSLVNIKVFKEYKYWPQVIGGIGMVVGYFMVGPYTLHGSNSGPGKVVFFSGLALFCVNISDLVLIGEPAFD